MREGGWERVRTRREKRECQITNDGGFPSEHRRENTRTASQLHASELETT